MNILGKLVVAGAAVFVGLQLIRPSIPARPAAAEVQASPEVKQILETHCYSCHSDQRRLSWFDQIVPAYWLVRHDILTARSHLNFSTLGSKPAAAQKATLFEAVNMIQLGAMPLPDFIRLHPDARVTPDEIAAMKSYLSPWGTPIAEPTAAQTEPIKSISLTTVRPEWNGFAFDPSFEQWKPISTTDRGDNYTFRFILGNEAAVKAAQTGNISPWPDGARFAKIAWHQELGSDGLVHPGKFVQVELMLKNASAYKDTEGWGWGRWRGMSLVPYGNSAHFVDECTACHQPMRGDDYVYTLPISTARIQGREIINNHAAALPANLPYQPLNWNAITMYVDPKAHQTATLYGNDAAMQAARASRSTPGYSAGAVLALVTWAQREDPHWFGGRIPDVPQSVEFVEVGIGAQQRGYRRFAGQNLSEAKPALAVATNRANFILGLPPVQLP